ncbi:MAG: class I SAM-dependent methyltransferase [Elusimicrobiota bacterium]
MLYDKKYFFSECEGYKTFLSSKGIKLSRRLLKIYYKILKLNPKRVLDFGCGRGELALNLALSWIETYACDISDDAIQIANEIRNYWIKTNPDIKLTIFKFENGKFDFEDNFFDLVVLSDVIEHLTDGEINNYFQEIKRILKKGGKIIIHTSPNKIFLNFGLKIYWFLAKINGLNLEFDMKKQLPYGMQKEYHKNEQTASSIRKHLKKAGFNKIEIEFWKNPHYVYYFLKEDRYIKILNKIYRFVPVKQLFFSDLFVSAEK